ncbi:MAG: hypoxanthine phosphoribosyltransferase [Fibrobacter sp.]|jgi:hypoxanthine phosphoribosyltransferase|nr:hypoxanthine phosphoribosyltransferase [Fibrobacter sp.]
MRYEISPKPLFSEAEIQNRVAELAREIDASFEYDLIAGILTGAFVFIADLSRRLSRRVPLRFIKASSYGERMTSGAVEIPESDFTPFAGKKILLIDDILDTGKTLEALVQKMKACGAAEVKTCVLLDKPSRREVPFQTDYRGFEIEDQFVVGYGMDYAENFRTLPAVFVMNPAP